VKVETDILSTTLTDASAFVNIWGEISALRESVGVRDDVLLDPLHFLTATDDTRRSCSVACWRGARLIGILYATEHYIRGLGTGYAIGGDYSGRGLLLCASEDENLVLQECIRRVFADGVHSLHVRFLPRESSRIALRGLELKFLDALIPGDRMELKAGFEEFLGTLGKHTRRNLRACTRKTEASGIEFVPSLAQEEYEAGVERLNSETHFPAKALHLLRDERLLELHDGERMGLRNRDGTLIAVLCGFRLGGRFHLLTQLNDASYDRLSLSLVLRGYAVRHMIDTGCTEIQFMGGSSLTFGRFCKPETYRSIFVDRERGLEAAVKRLCGAAVGLLSRTGRPVPEALAVLASGCLEERQLSQRTALRPAAMILRQRQAL
jgi:hypothetical protein